MTLSYIFIEQIEKSNSCLCRPGRELDLPGHRRCHRLLSWGGGPNCMDQNGNSQEKEMSKLFVTHLIKCTIGQLWPTDQSLLRWPSVVQAVCLLMLA